MKKIYKKTIIKILMTSILTASSFTFVNATNTPPQPQTGETQDSTSNKLEQIIESIETIHNKIIEIFTNNASGNSPSSASSQSNAGEQPTKATTEQDNQ